MKRVFLIGILAVAACSGKLPETRYYQLAPPAAAGGGELVIVLEPLSTEAAYDDERIVYRTTPYRLDYYQYHRWSAAPGAMIGNYLEQALERSGKFRAVVREATPDAPVVLGGRVVALEEVDVAPQRWMGRVVVELTLTDTKTGATVWTEQCEESQPLTAQNPEGLAVALSEAMARIVAKTAPKIAEVAERQKTAQASSAGAAVVKSKTAW